MQYLIRTNPDPDDNPWDTSTDYYDDTWNDGHYDDGGWYADDPGPLRN